MDTVTGGVQAAEQGGLTRLRTLLERYYARYYRDTLGLPDWRTRLIGRLSEEEPAAAQLASIERVTGPFARRRVLNVGCGTGGFNIAAERVGARTWGIDASEEAVAICELRRALGAGGAYAVAKAEALPFRDGIFDIAVCLSTLEHVADVGCSIREMVRVLRPGGSLFVYAPSAWACYESHYKLAWLPWFPRPLARGYLRLRRRPTGFVDTLNRLSESRCRQLLEAAGADVKEVGDEAGDWRATSGVLTRAYYGALRARPYVALLARKPTA